MVRRGDGDETVTVNTQDSKSMLVSNTRNASNINKCELNTLNESEFNLPLSTKNFPECEDA